MSRTAGNAPKVQQRSTKPERSAPGLDDSLFDDPAPIPEAERTQDISADELAYVVQAAHGQSAAAAEPEAFLDADAAMMIDDEPPTSPGKTMPARYTPEAAAAAKAAADAAEGIAPAPALRSWPEAVPSREETLLFLTASAQPSAELLAVTQALLQSLTEAEFSALNDTEPAGEVLILRDAVVTRWRLAAALAQMPKEVSALSTEALDALLAEADVSLGALKPAEIADETLKAGYESARSALTRDAVELSGAGQVLTQQAAAATAKLSARKYKNVAARITNIESVDAKVAEKQSARSRNLVVGVVLSAILAVGFHSYRYFTSSAVSGPSPVRVENLPPGAVGMKGFNGGPTVIQSSKRKAFTAADRSQLEAKAQEEGGKLIELSPSNFVIAPDNFGGPESGRKAQ